tara:strand:+ start:136239 stop:136733 length:495 start_codon:yes stop_codon:yes gene_type:complete
MKKIISLIVVLSLCACGYSPVYKQTKELVESVQVREVRMVDIIRSAGERRVAQLTNKRLSQVFIAGEDSAYKLDITIEETKNTLAVLRDATEDRLEIVLQAELTLYNTAGEKVFERSLSAEAPYNVETSPFGTDSGKDRARKSAAISLAEEVIHQVNYFMYTQK